MAEFFAMGGYAVYVWASFGLTAVVMIAMWGFSKRELARRTADLDAMQARSGGARKRSGRIETGQEHEIREA